VRGSVPSGILIIHRFVWRIADLRTVPAAVRFLSMEPLLGPIPNVPLYGVDWVIVGGETGPRHRPIDPVWVRDLRDQCVAAGVAFFFKQWGGFRPKSNGRLLDGRTWDEFPVARATSDRCRITEGQAT
jgi:protein gp37